MKLKHHWSNTIGEIIVVCRHTVIGKDNAILPVQVEIIKYETCLTDAVRCNCEEFINEYSQHLKNVQKEREGDSEL